VKGKFVKNLIDSGKYFYPLLAADAAPGDLIVRNLLIGVAVAGGKAGERITCDRFATVSLPKAAGALSQGDPAYWNGGAVTSTELNNTLVGAVAEDAAAGDETAAVILMPVTKTIVEVEAST
jgi:predicted RecA/RadA family phage recombinase